MYTTIYKHDRMLTLYHGKFNKTVLLLNSL